MTRILLCLSPALATILIGLLTHLNALMLAGAWATAIIAAATPLAIAAQRNHRSLGAALGATAGAMAIRLGGLVLVAVLFAGHQDLVVVEVAIAICLFMNLIIEGVITARTGGAPTGEGTSHG